MRGTPTRNLSHGQRPGSPLSARRLESVQEISRLGAEYCHGLDGRDMDRFLRIWHPEAGGSSGPDVRPVGHAEIRELVSGGIWPAFSETHHWMSNLVIDVDGDTATGQCDIDATVRGRSEVRGCAPRPRTTTPMSATKGGGCCGVAMPSPTSRRRSGSQTARAPALGDVVLALSGVSKTFGGEHALRDVELDVRQGEVHALMGENSSREVHAGQGAGRLPRA
ncbi:MAG: nuclear transport factor 2 family protein [Solirubrobacterales bacterium]